MNEGGVVVSKRGGDWGKKFFHLCSAVPHPGKHGVRSHCSSVGTVVISLS